jgi:hypothetical protein
MTTDFVGTLPTSLVSNPLSKVQVAQAGTPLFFRCFFEKAELRPCNPCNKTVLRRSFRRLAKK